MKKWILFLCLLLSISFQSVSIYADSSSSYILMDQENGSVLYQKNIHNRFLTASIAKIMTAMVAIENGNLFETYTVTKSATLVEGSSLYLEEGDQIYLIDLLYGLMLRSGNDAATLISEVVFESTDIFVYQMNVLAKRIGMKNSTFENPTGLDSSSYNYSTAYDMALLMRYACQNEIFLEIASKKLYRASTEKYRYTWENKHRLVRDYDYILAGKTGYTKKSGRTLVSYAELDGLKLICVSFKESDDFNLHKTMFLKASKEYQKKKILDKGVYPQKISELNYYPMIEKEVSLLVKENSIIEVKFYLNKEPEEKCGYLVIYENGLWIYEAPLYTYRIKIE